MTGIYSSVLSFVAFQDGATSRQIADVFGVSPHEALVILVQLAAHNEIAWERPPAHVGRYDVRAVVVDGESEGDSRRAYCAAAARVIGASVLDLTAE